MRLAQQVVKNIIKKLLNSEDYRAEIISLINVEFLQFAIDFFKKVIDSKLNNQSITADWYKKEFLHSGLKSKDIAIHAGLNMKTINNMFNSGKKEVVIDASHEHYDILYESIKNLVSAEKELELKLTLKFNHVSVDLNISETLIVINTLAVKRSELRGGLWSSAGKRVEKPLMQILCKLYNVPVKNYRTKTKKAKTSDDFMREIDFYLIGDKEHKCEVKLMGKGNPESADVVIARGSKVFIADKLSDMNKKQLDKLDVEWLALRDTNGFQRFKTILKRLNIPFNEKKLSSKDIYIDKALSEIFS